MDLVSRTSIGVAAMRAWESQRPDRWFDDTYAARFAEVAGVHVHEPEDPVMRAIARSIVVRTRWIDEVLAAADAPQVVVLGAGLDSRAWRLRWPDGTTVWELDRAEVLDVKASVITEEPACDRRPVVVDLLDDWPAALAAAGHDPTTPTTWLAEGLLVYLEDAEVERLLARVTDLSPPGSRVVLTLGAARGAPAALADVWLSRAPEDPVAWLDGHGWDATARRWGDLAVEWGRPDWQARTRTPGLVEAVRRVVA